MRNVSNWKKRKAVVKIVVSQTMKPNNFFLSIRIRFSKGNELRPKDDLKRKVRSEINAVNKESQKLLIRPEFQNTLHIWARKVRVNGGIKIQRHRWKASCETSTIPNDVTGRRKELILSNNQYVMGLNSDS